MSQIVAIVVKLDNGKYRRLHLDRIKSIYTDSKYITSGTLKEGEGDVAGPETDAPDFTPTAPSATTTRSAAATADGNGDNGNGPGPECVLINGVWICH